MSRVAAVQCLETRDRRSMDDSASTGIQRSLVIQDDEEISRSADAVVIAWQPCEQQLTGASFQIATQRPQSFPAK